TLRPSPFDEYASAFYVAEILQRLDEGSGRAPWRRWRTLQQVPQAIDFRLLRHDGELRDEKHEGACERSEGELHAATGACWPSIARLSACRRSCATRAGFLIPLPSL